MRKLGLSIMVLGVGTGLIGVMVGEYRLFVGGVGIAGIGLAIDILVKLFRQ